MERKSLKERIRSLAVQDEGKIDIEGIIREVGEDLLKWIGEGEMAEFQDFTNLRIPRVRHRLLNSFLDVEE